MRPVVMAAVLLLLVGCMERVGAPVAAGLDAEEGELADYLADLHRSAADLDRSGPLRGRLGMAYHANGFDGAAAVTYAQARALDPEEFLWPYLHGFVLAGSGDLEGGVRELDAALAIDPNYAPAWLQRATWLLDLDRLGDAAEAFARTLALDDAEVGVAAQAGLARVFIREGRGDEAVAVLEPLLARHGHPDLHRLLGRAYRVAGRSDEATAAIARGKDAPPLRWRDEHREATESHVRGFHGRLSLAEAHLQRGEAMRAAVELESLGESRPDDRTLINNLSIAYQRTGRNERALEVLRTGLETHPDYPLFHFNVASLLEDLGRPSAAIEHFTRAAELDPPLVAAFERKGLLLTREGRHSEAVATFEALVPFGEATEAFHHAAMIAGSLGRWASAIDLLEHAVRLDPEFTTGHVFLARALAETGRFDEAREVLSRAAELGTHPDDVASAGERLAALETGAS